MHTTTTGSPVEPRSAVVRPLGQNEVTITGGFWRDVQERNARVTIDHCLQWMERIGWCENFDRAATGEAFEHSGIEFVDSEVYKLLEAMAWELGRNDDAALDAAYRALVARVAAAQESDGYLHTSFGRPGQPARYSNLEWGHELYCFGHLIQAAVARLRTGHDDDLPAIARRLADHIVREFGPTGRVAVCGHPEVEVALAEFARATGDADYLELARLFIERRGSGTLRPIEFGPAYFQDDVPVREATVLRGHAVRALYLAAGAADVAVDTGDTDLLSAVERQWEATVARRTYITGGVGSHHQDESFGDDFELPPDRAYAETCAAIASNMLSWRLLLQTGDEKYADLIERTLLNGILVAVREDGGAFFYTNTLHQRTPGTVPDEHEVNRRALSSLRAPWFEVSCCPTNVARTLASVGAYFATADDAGVQLHQYGGYRVDTVLDSGVRAVLDVETDYPASPTITVRVADATDGPFTLSLRVPVWARGSARLTVDGADADASGERLDVRVRTGSVIVLELPMPVRVTRPDPRIDAVRGQVAIERGPLVLALEGVDLPEGVPLDGVSVDLASPVVDTRAGTRARVRRIAPASSGWPYATAEPTERGEAFEVPLLPYARWGNRGPSTMRVWIPAD